MEPHEETVGLTEDDRIDQTQKHSEETVVQHVGHNEELNVHLVVE